MGRAAKIVGYGAAAALAATVTGRAQAQSAEQGFSVNRFEPSEQNNEWFANDSLDLRGRMRPSFGATLDGQYRPVVVYRSDDSIAASPVRNVGTLHLGAAVNLFDRVRVGLSVPIVLFQDGRQTAFGTKTIALPASEQALGDARIGLDVRLLGEHQSPFTLAIGARVWLPTGDQASYSGDGNVRVAPHVAAAGDIGVFTYAGQVAMQLGRSERYFGATSLGQELNFAAAAGVRVLSKRLVIGPEVFGSTVVVSDPATGNTSGVTENTAAQTSLEAMLGAHYTVGSLRFGAAGGGGVSRGLGSPERRWIASFEFVPSATADADGDGILDKDDACPRAFGLKNADITKNGCPEDRDGDGIFDTVDACPMVAGVASQDAKKNGCPEDRDGDGILDKDDACPMVAGSANDDPRKNGCPADKDGDGVLDKDDACIDAVGLKTSDPKTNGCPADKDGDGIFDKDDACVDVKGIASDKAQFNGCPVDIDADSIQNDKDACPREAGKANADPAKNGCPTAYVSGGVINILEQVKFKTASAEILAGKDTEDVLQAVLGVLTSHPEIKKLNVEGHTDNKGAAAMNKTLSANRAASVVKWLVGHGIDAARLASAGYGPERPLADNKTEDGRRQNRRVEFHIVTEGGGTTTTISTPTAPTPAPAAAPAAKPATPAAPAAAPAAKPATPAAPAAAPAAKPATKPATPATKPATKPATPAAKP